ncbi:hypothetical protein SAMN02799624_06569 [Paenibacillus sp. UNC496MF]|nr:hypothetical protein SAMN02799624_06569 [Paenibacillus sp. UNC496MF]
MQILNVLLFLALLSAVTTIQVRRLFRKHEVTAGVAYLGLMSVAAAMYAVVILSKKFPFSPLSLLQFPFEHIGKYLIGP